MGGREADNLLFKVAEEDVGLVCRWVAFLCCCMVVPYPGVWPQEVEDVVCKLSQIRISCLWTGLWRLPAVVVHGLMLLGRQE